MYATLDEKKTKEQEHKLNYWLKTHGFRETGDNRKSLKSLIKAANVNQYMDRDENFDHEEISIYFKKYKWLWERDFEKN